MQIARSISRHCSPNFLKKTIVEGVKAPSRAGWHPCRNLHFCTLLGFTSPINSADLLTAEHSARRSEEVSISLLNQSCLEASLIESPQNPRIAGSAANSLYFTDDRMIPTPGFEPGLLLPALVPTLWN